MKEEFAKQLMPDPAVGVATKAELEALEALRSTPLLRADFTPDGDTVQVVNTAVREWSENRIAHLKERLDVAREGFEHDLDRSFEGGF